MAIVWIFLVGVTGLVSGMLGASADTAFAQNRSGIEAALNRVLTTCDRLEKSALIWQHQESVSANEMQISVELCHKIRSEIAELVWTLPSLPQAQIYQSLIDQMRRNAFAFHLTHFRAQESLIRDGASLQALSMVATPQNVAQAEAVIPGLSRMYERLRGHQAKLATSRKIALSEIAVGTEELQKLKEAMDRCDCKPEQARAVFQGLKSNLSTYNASLLELPLSRVKTLASQPAIDRGSAELLPVLVSNLRKTGLELMALVEGQVEIMQNQYLQLTDQQLHLGKLARELGSQLATTAVWLEQSQSTHNKMRAVVDAVSPRFAKPRSRKTDSESQL